MADSRFLRGTMVGRVFFMFMVSTLLNSVVRGNETLFSEPPSFDIGRTVNLAAVVSCGGGIRNLTKATCVIADKDGDSNHSRSGQSELGCLACDPKTNTRVDVNHVLWEGNTSEWRSLPKEQNSQLQELNITIYFPQVFKVQRISVKAGNTPLPAVWAIEMSRDADSSFEPVRYYAPEDCSSYFGVKSGNETSMDSVCILRPSSSWEESVEVNFQASGIHLRFLKMWSSFNQNESNLDYYSVRRISIEGRCVCNGNANECTPTEEGTMVCQCQHNTCGDHCQTCCDGYTRNYDLVCVERANETERSRGALSEAMKNGGVPLVQQENHTLVVPRENITLLDAVDDTTLSPLTQNITVPLAFDENDTFVVLTKNITVRKLFENSTVSPLTENIVTPMAVEENRTSILPTENFMMEVDDKNTESSLVGNITAPLAEDENRTVWEPIENSTVSSFAENVTVSLLEDENSTSTVLTENRTVWEPVENSTISPSGVNVTVSLVEEGNITSIAPTENRTVWEQIENSTVSPFTENVTVLLVEEENSTSIGPTKTSTVLEPVENSTISPLTVNDTSAPAETNSSLIPPTKDIRTLAITESDNASSVGGNVTLLPASGTVIVPTVSPLREENTTMLLSTVASNKTENVTVSPPTESTMVPTAAPTSETSTDNSTERTVVTVPSASRTTSQGLEGPNTTQSLILQTTTEKDSTKVVTADTRSVSTTVRATLTESVDNVTKPQPGENSTTPSLETGSEPSTAHATAQVTAVLTTTTPSTDESTTNTPSMVITGKPTIAHDRTEVTTVQATSEPTVKGNVTKSTSVVTGSERNTARTITESSTVQITEPTAEENSTKSASVVTSSTPTVEDAAQSSSAEPITATATKEATNQPSTAQTSSEPTTEQTTTTFSIQETSASSTVQTYVTNTTSTINESSNVSTTTEPTTLQTATETTTLKTTTIPTTVQTTTVPTTLKATPVPTTLKATTVPTTVQTTTEPTTPQATTVPTTVKTTIKPTTERELTENEARILFGNLPKGVCYCSKFATMERQCFPTALHKPCDCRPNFAGSRCERCALGYFNYPFCIPCRCNPEGSTSLACDRETGRCSCKLGIGGRKCDACPFGSYDFPTCSPCECNPSGSYSTICDPYSGKCPCRYGVRGRQCDRCPAGYYSFPNCQWCGCNPLTTTENICEEFFGSFRCLCRSNFKGLRCGECRRGYYDFPLCKSCECSPLGYGSCNQRGECVCNEGYAGSQCDRCAGGYYGYPNCRACNCNTFGSYSKLCNDTTGQCQCKPSIQAKQCDRCAKGMVGFPTCVKCECHPDGTRFLPGITSSMCFGSAKYQCLCKPNVVGRVCDRCLHGFYNFSASNPLGCSSCGCSTRGTISGTRYCHADSGRCDCKKHVIGGKCENCRDGYTGLRSHDIFGCRECKCDPGGSVSRDCFKHLGDCQCRPGVTGKKCNRLLSSRPLFFPTLYHIYAEFEDAVLMSSSRTRVQSGADMDVFPSFSGTGYAILSAYKAFVVAVNIPKTRRYRIIFHYVLKDSLRVSAKVELFVRGAKTPTHSFEVHFSPPSAQQTKNLRMTFSEGGFSRDFLMKNGSWNVAVTSHSSMLLLDYIVFIPEDYYKAELLQDVPSGPCLVRASKPEHCDMYTYYEPKNPLIVTVPGDSGYTVPLRGHLDMFRDPRFNLIDLGLSNMALLGRNQPTIGYDISVPESGPYVLMVKYLHPEKYIQRVFVTVGYERGMLEILPCKYQFACRQFVMDDHRRPRAFEMKKTPEVNVVKLESSASAKLAVISVTAIPQAKWNPEYVQPALLCRMFNKSCIYSSYRTPTDAIQLPAFSQRNQDQTTSLFTGFVNMSGAYHIIVRYRQPSSLSKKFELLSIRSPHGSRNATVQFQYCPANPGCRAVVGVEENLSFHLKKGLFTAVIQHERRTQLEYMLLVPQDTYSTGLTELLSTDKVATFLHNCGKEHFYINPVKGKHCREDVFSLTIRFNGQPLPCKCNVLGSKSTFCEQFGGQCLCRPNVIGRRCDRCRLGYSAFPRCKRCGCHEVGSLSPGCTSSGRCLCKKGFGGYKCDRCISSGYYGFPDCKACGCDDVGSLSVFCRSRDGQCQCRRNFQGLRCNECRIGFYDFPTCKACNCNPAGIKLLPGQTNGCGYVNNTRCSCKDNVEGNECDSCKDLHFNLQIDNPFGCQSCGCNTNGSLGTIKSCDQASGQCLCKSHVTGRTCGRCKEGFYNLDGPDVFGCRRCSCNAGGSISSSCNAVTGVCSCLSGISGTQCDRVSSDEYYYPTLHQFKTELEDALTESGGPAYFRQSESEFPSFSWRGYVVFSQSQNFISMIIDVPRTTKYQLIFYYMLGRLAPVTALVKFIPTLDSDSLPSGPPREQTVDARFRSTASWIFATADFLVVRDTWGDTQHILLSQGKWKLTIAAPASDLLVDYLVLLPEEYYRPQNLQVQASRPCEMSGDQKYCLHFTSPSLDQQGFVTIEAEDSSVFGGIRRNQRLPDIPFQGLILSGSRNVMTVRLPSSIQGEFVLMASYFHNADDDGVMSLVLRSGVESYRAQMSILSCRYRFGCRQVAVDQSHKVQVFTADPSEVGSISLTTRLTVALDSITAIPLSKWNPQLIVPVEQCVSNGFSCVQASYPIPPDAIRIETEDRVTGGDRGPYYILDRRASLKYLRVGEKTLHVSGSARSGRYYVVVHFYQPNFLSFVGKVVVSGQNAASTLMKFHYCPHVSGCRAVGTSQYRDGMIESIYVGRQNSILVSIVIPEDKDVWIDYVLLVPLQSFSLSLVETKPVDVTQDFIQDCGQYTFFLKESSSQFCLRSAFTITTRFNNGALPCKCDHSGATKRSCQSFGGQCSCRPNVIGRKCDRCKSGYSGFPYCRKLAI